MRMKKVTDERVRELIASKEKKRITGEQPIHLLIYRVSVAIERNANVSGTREWKRGMECE